MNYQPVVPFSGILGWQVLNRTQDAQRAAFEQSAVNKREHDYFAEKIGKIDSAEELVKDFRLLRVALGAFGLEEDINNKFFVRKVLEEGSINEDALANKLTDRRYLDFAKAFGFGDFDTPNTKLSTFPNEILSKFKERSFENAVGDTNQDMRLAMNAKRELADLAADDASETTKWYTILGTPPLRTVFETALGLPTSFGQLPIERQLEEIRSRAESRWGSSEISQFSDDASIEKLVENFLVMGTLQQSATAFTSPTLQLFGIGV